jgi:choline dehydrogenase-like flavoprotein
MEPTDQNRVFLLDERDRSGLFRPAARLVFGARDLENVEESLRLLGETLIGSGLGRVRIVNDEIYLRCTGGGHIMGTTRMGDDPKTSVVDLNCRVHGYANFFVAGSSVFTTSGAANPTLTIVALALRLGEHLRRA